MVVGTQRMAVHVQVLWLCVYMFYACICFVRVYVLCVYMFMETGGSGQQQGPHDVPAATLQQQHVIGH